MGRRGRGVELNPDFIEIFKRRTLPDFQASWESQATTRALGRNDQMREAELIMRLRALKAGKELSKTLERWIHERPTGVNAGGVQSILVEDQHEYSSFLDIEKGVVTRPPVGLTVLAETDPDDRDALAVEISSALRKPPFSVLGLELSVKVQDRSEFLAELDISQLHEFEQARRASFTNPLETDLNGALPRLLTTSPLDRVVHGDKLSPLDLARKEAERRVLQNELALADDTADLAARLSLPQARVQELLLDHGLDEAQQTFGISVSIPVPRSEG